MRQDSESSMNWLLFCNQSQLADYRQIILALSSGVLMGLSPAPLNLWLLSWVALVPLWCLIFQNQRSIKSIILLSLSWGFGYHGLALFWITGIHPMTWMGVPWLASLLIAIAVWLIIAFWGAFLVIVWAVLFVFIERLFLKLNHSNLIFYRVLLGLTIWCCLETLWSYSPLWWSSLSYTQSPNNLAILQLAKFSGFNAVTAAIVAVNGLIAEIILSKQVIFKNKINFKKTFFIFKFNFFLFKQKIIICLPLLLFTGLHLWGFWLYNQSVTVNNLEPIKVGIIQGNIPNEIKLYSEGWARAIKGYTTGYQTLAAQKVDVVLTPETALPFYWNDITNNSDFYRAVIKEKVPAWVGAFGQKGTSYTNSLFTLTGEGKTFSRYDKSKLVPLGEYIPFEPIIGKIIDRLSPLEAHLQAGKPDRIFNTPFGQAIVGICYESVFSQHFRRQTRERGEFIISASNNAHYSTAMPAQHHAQDVIRAIESDRWAARATNTGYSAIVDPHGNTIWRSRIDRYQIHAGTIYRRQTKTLYVRWGDWLTRILLIISVISCCALGVSK
jgi:apolipoprotein N-acyltransferase